jgi:hypothetical protein
LPLDDPLRVCRLLVPDTPVLLAAPPPHSTMVYRVH